MKAKLRRSNRIFSWTLAAILLTLYTCTNFQEEQKEEPVQETSEPADSSDQSVDYEAQGQQHVLKAQSIIAKNLISAVKGEGPEYALSFCQSRALPLTDSVAQTLGIQLRRVSDKPRNPANQANEEETAFIKESKDRAYRGEALTNAVTEEGGEVIAYYPILTNALCLQCHGNPETDINPETLKKIKTLYPEDQATDHEANEVRGLWVVRMAKL